MSTRVGVPLKILELGTRYVEGQWHQNLASNRPAKLFLWLGTEMINCNYFCLPSDYN